MQKKVKAKVWMQLNTKTLMFVICKKLREFFTISKVSWIDENLYTNNNDVKLVRYTNNDWTGNVETRKSTSRYAFHLDTRELCYISSITKNNSKSNAPKVKYSHTNIVTVSPSLH
ncbi:hypothetical protein CR513_50787, partial [Mucuna pruriens]